MKNFSEELLSQYYANDRKSVFPLNNLQLEIKNQIQQKMDEGIYQYEYVNCPICDTYPKLRTLSQKERNGHNQKIVLCKNCGLIQNFPRMTQSSYN